MADLETRRRDDCTEIIVEAEGDFAVVVRQGEEEMIYLPPFEAGQNSYYVRPDDQLDETSEGFRIFYLGEPTDIEVFER